MTFNLNEFRPLIDYLSMGALLAPSIPTYSGGLEVLAGDIFRSCADLEVPLVGTILASTKGHFKQKIGEDGRQYEEPVNWSPKYTCKRIKETVTIKHKGHDLVCGAEVFLVKGENGFVVPVFLLDTDFEDNSKEDRDITGILYDGNEETRLAQENVLGQAGVKLMRKLGYDSSITTYSMNEGHAAFAKLEILAQNGHNFEKTKSLCTFTTHTPVEVAHETWDYERVSSIVGDFLPEDIRELGGQDRLSMTELLSNLSRDINAVAEKHQRVCKAMPIFNGKDIGYITNGIHLKTWAVEPISKLYDTYLEHWKLQPEVLEGAVDHIPSTEVLNAKAEAKDSLIDFINSNTPAEFNPDAATIVWARRFTEYKRPLLLFRDIDRLHRLADEYGPINVIYAGKAHPMDIAGKKMIKEVIVQLNNLGNNLKGVFLENYNFKMAKMLLGGADAWLNTPRRPLEASGTSGMKAALNGTLNLTVWDGWVPEGYQRDPEGMFIIGPKNSEQVRVNPNHVEEDDIDSKGLYDAIKQFLDIYYEKGYKQNLGLAERITHSIRLAYHFNTHRVVRAYAQKWGINFK